MKGQKNQVYLHGAQNRRLENSTPWHDETAGGPGEEGKPLSTTNAAYGAHSSRQSWGQTGSALPQDQKPDPDACSRPRCPNRTGRSSQRDWQERSKRRPLGKEVKLPPFADGTILHTEATWQSVKNGHGQQMDSAVSALKSTHENLLCLYVLTKKCEKEIKNTILIAIAT